MFGRVVEPKLFPHGNNLSCLAFNPSRSLGEQSGEMGGVHLMVGVIAQWGWDLGAHLGGRAPSCAGQWHNPGRGDESYLAPWNEYQSCVLPQRGEKILQIGIHACVVLKQTALLNPIIISLLQWRTTGEHLVHARLIFLLESTSSNLLFYLILIPKKHSS